MNVITLILASAGMSLGLIGPDSKACPEGCEKTCCETAQGEEAEGKSCCPLCPSDKLPEIETAAYANANWPAFNDEEELYSKNLQGQKMPAPFGKETILNEGMELEQLKGKVLVVDFWATWCGPCIAAAPKLASLQKAHSEDLMVVAVSGMSEDEQTVRSFLAEHKEPFMQLFDAEQNVLNHFETQGIPLVVVLSTDGVIRWMGNPHEAEFKAVVEQVIDADPLIEAKG